ncbi:MAG: L-threonylcarbamoyladenylate synthase [Candidatus Anstonellales archaeon]
MKILRLKDEYDKCLEEAGNALLNNELIVYPTDTVYGLGAIATHEEAIKKVYEAKSRDNEKKLTVMVGNLQQLLQYFSPEPLEIRYIYSYLPGPYTFIMKAKKELMHIGDEVGVRVIDHYFCRKLCLYVNAPIISTSANISGKEPITMFEQLDKELEKFVSIAIDGGKLKYSMPSTIVNIRKKEIIRQGAGDFKWLH